ncbi:FMN-dependent NADH-azoreductase [Pseudoalteromonas ardens]|uniref:FMN dependent NADH:quinone oxidoreductase n=1 Tax=Pseudoalteromonas rubra TaxID=43658 RepID=A0A0L0EQ22_9GAMM|nr:NAD(P)H-dependent oxidoreductase [Pseudoalteromonas sp. R96]KNC66485.1 FMN-dependent NADH-azoreductase [Pseudoalteromonas rubra]MDK1313194.1 NAD(P)H-dependent oxidoreductase [Pseudoalteromonas sp. R96]
MSTILHIDSSVRAIDNDNPSHNSLSKQIARQFVESWQETSSIDEYIYRDVGVHPPQFITQDWIGAVFTPQGKRTADQKRLLALSDTLIDELTRADIIVISTPMYNYGMPAQLKAWFDQIVRVNKTFDFDLKRGDFPLAPLLSGKTLVAIASCGEFGFEEPEIRAKSNHLMPHLRTLSRYLGVETMYEIVSEYQEFADDRHQASLTQAFEQAQSLALALAQSQQITHIDEQLV